MVPSNTIKSDCLLGRNFLSYSRVILSVSDGQFVIMLKQTENILFDEILSVDIDNNNENNLDVDLDIETTLPTDIKTIIKQIYITMTRI